MRNSSSSFSSLKAERSIKTLFYKQSYWACYLPQHHVESYREERR